MGFYLAGLLTPRGLPAPAGLVSPPGRIISGRLSLGGRACSLRAAPSLRAGAIRFTSGAEPGETLSTAGGDWIAAGGGGGGSPGSWLLCSGLDSCAFRFPPCK